MAACGGWKVHGMDECSLDDCLVTGNSMGWMNPVVEMRGVRGLTPPPPKCARKCANLRNLKANVQILDRKTPPPKCFTLFRLLDESMFMGWLQCSSMDG